MEGGRRPCQPTSASETSGGKEVRGHEQQIQEGSTGAEGQKSAAANINCGEEATAEGGAEVRMHDLSTPHARHFNMV